MRSIWKGAISFGLVSIPVKMYAATETKNIHFNFLHRECKTPIKYQKVCPRCDREVQNEEIVRGYEYEKGKYVIMEDEDFENLPLETVRTIDIIDFVNLADIDPIYYVKSYFLAPGEFAHKAYRLFFEALDRTGKVGIAKIFIRSRENLTALRCYHNSLLMETMLFPDEIRNTAELTELDTDVKVSAHELKMAQDLIKNLSAEFVPEKYSSDYRKALMKVIRAKVERKEIEIPEVPKQEKVVDLMEALKASLKATEAEKVKRPKKKVARGSG